MKLSVVIPCYNEIDTLQDIVAKVLSADLVIDREVILVDDCSTDGTRNVLERLGRANEQIKTIFHEKNRGKGAALRSGFEVASGDIILIQDADLEYDPNDYHKLLTPILDGRADVVYGSRFLGGDCHRVLYFWHSVGNRLLTLLSNMFTDLNVTDMEVCYKVFRRQVVEGMTLKEDRFGFEPEFTAKISRQKWRIYEVGISYFGRTYEEGKKISWRDGVRAAYVILKYGLWS